MLLNPCIFSLKVVSTFHLSQSISFPFFPHHITTAEKSLHMLHLKQALFYIGWNLFVSLKLLGSLERFYSLFTVHISLGSLSHHSLLHLLLPCSLNIWVHCTRAQDSLATFSCYGNLLDICRVATWSSADTMLCTCMKGEMHELWKLFFFLFFNRELTPPPKVLCESPNVGLHMTMEKENQVYFIFRIWYGFGKPLVVTLFYIHPLYFHTMFGNCLSISYTGDKTWWTLWLIRTGFQKSVLY